MKKVMIIVLLCWGMTGLTIAGSLQEVRLLYQQAPLREKACRALLDLLESVALPGQPLLTGYKGGATMIMAGHQSGPLAQWSYFSRGKALLEKAIRADTGNVELRFIRLSIQMNTPSFLGYDKHIQADKARLIASLTQLKDKGLQNMIIIFLKQSGELTDRERQQLKQVRLDEIVMWVHHSIKFI